MNPTQEPSFSTAEPKMPTGLPGLRTWRAVYLVVLGTLVLWIVLLTMLPLVFS